MRLPPALERPVRRVEARLRLARALRAGTLLVVPGAALAALVVAAVKTGALAPSKSAPWLAAAAALPFLGLVVGALRRVPRLLPAELLDRAHGLKSRVASALEFSAIPEVDRTPFMRAAVDDAVARAASLRPALALPLRAPKDLGAAFGSCAVLALVLALEVPVERVLPPPRLVPAAMLDEDSLEGFRSELTEVLAENPPDPEVAAVGRELNRVLEDIADRRLERTEALREIAELERRLAEGRAADADTMDQALREMGRRLAGASELTAASEALVDADAERAEAAMRELAESVRGEAMSRAELTELRRSLERAAERETAAEQELARREEENERLLERRREEAAEENQEQSLLRRRQRELERLEREQERVTEQRRRRERRRRAVERAAEDLNRQQRESAADALERGAEDLNRTAREQMSEEQRRDLEAQMRQLREMIRRQREQQGQDGQEGQQRQSGQGGQGNRLQRYVLRAQGQGGQEARLRMPGQGQGQQGGQAGQQGGAGSQGGQAGQQGGAGSQGGQAGQQGGAGGQGGQGQGQGVVELTMGQGGDAVLELPGMGEGREGAGEGGGEPGSGAGTEHDPDMLADPTHLNSRGQRSQIEGQHGEGPSRSEVILGAADRGFASTPYRRVFTDYSDHAEEVLERDEVPAGYRFYVRRYFQLIRPREGAAAPEETPR